MRILFVSCNFPQDLKKSVFGMDKRMAMFVEAFKGLGELDMLFYVPSEVRVDAGRRLALEGEMAAHWGAKLRLTLCAMPSAPKKPSLWQTYGQGALSFYKQPLVEGASGPEQVRAFRNCLERRPDLIFAHRLRSMCPVLLAQQQTAPVFLDLDDIEHVALIRSVGQPPRWRSKRLRYLQVPALMWGERKATKRARKTFVCSNRDARYLSRLWRLPGITTIPNGVEIPDGTPVPAAQNVLFLGRYSYTPNANAAEYLIQSVWPSVRRACPAARLIIAGEGAQQLRSYDDHPDGVEFRGFVDNLDELYRGTRVVCSPIQSGGGTRVKIVEAAAHGRPIVATSLGAEGLAMRDGESILLRDDPEAFAQACVWLLQDDHLAAQLGERARQHAIAAFDRNLVVAKIRSEITTCVNASAATGRPAQSLPVPNNGHGD
jgi:glycosyltransferase involved in cell wall biosynthesis